MASTDSTLSLTASELENPSLPTASPLPTQSSAESQPTLQALPPLVTSNPLRSSQSQRVPSYAKNRLSTFSVSSSAYSRSRPQSTAYPIFHSSLPYAFVRDFSYPVNHFMHYGPPPDPVSTISTPASEFHKRLSDSIVPHSGGSRGQWATEPELGEAFYTGQQLPATAYGDGPPWSEDEDLQSPIVTSTKSRKGRSKIYDGKEARGRHHQGANGAERTSVAPTNQDGNKIIYVGQDGESANGPGGEYVTLPAGANDMDYFTKHRRSQASQSGAVLSGQSYDNAGDGQITQNHGETDSGFDPDESRYSRNYQFTIASPDEEMHGKAVALYDFARENENELPLREGQVIWVSYRHGEGWLVAQDPKSEETGLVPEGFVRLVRDIEGGLASLNGDISDGSPISPEVETPTMPPHPELTRSTSDKSKHYAPIVSQFTTSSRDLDPYPSHLLGPQANTQVGPDATSRGRSDGTKSSPEPVSLEKPAAPEDSGTEEGRLSQESEDMPVQP